MYTTVSYDIRSLSYKQENNIPILECVNYANYPFPENFQFKIAKTLDTDTGQFTIEDMKATECLFYTILVSPSTLNILYKNKYEFPKNQAEFTQNISLYVKSEISNDTYKQVIYLAQQLLQFKNIYYEGPE